MKVLPELPEPAYDAAGARELDRMAIERHGMTGLALMERAGETAYRTLRDRWPRAERLCVACGSGNNGGDGYVVARLAREEGLRPLVIADRAPGTADAAAMRERYLAAGGEIRSPAAGLPEDADAVVDALLGTGVARDVEGPARELIEAINTAGCPVLALDVPSGLDAGTGCVHGTCVVADLTVTFIGLKLGLLTGRGPAMAGEVVYAGLGVPPEVHGQVPCVARRITVRQAMAWLPRRPRDAHKGAGGHVLVVGGEHGMSGAARMAGEAAARVGAGLVGVATRERHAGVLGTVRPELMVAACEQARDLAALRVRATVIAVGPGLGTDSWGRRMWAAVLDSGKPLVVDADALNLLAAEPAMREDWVLTPHPGEAARLLACTVAQVQSDRPAAVREIAARFGGVCVLKGAGTLVHGGADVPWVCDLGNPGMASGGMGDVLTGVIAGLRAQRLAPMQAAAVGAWLHAAAGDRAAAEGGAIGLLATDLMPHLRALVNAPA